MILKNCHNRNTNLSVGWIDYKEAFDSVPYSWIEKCLKKFKISHVLRNFLSHSMRMWKTTLYAFFISNTFISNARLKLAKHQNAKQHSEII